MESVEDNEVIIPESLRNVSEDILIDSNGDCSVEHIMKISLDDMKSEKFNLSSSGSIGTKVKKGYGLKKWKRIPRESSKERCNSVDNSKIGKRGLSNATPDSRNPVLSSETTKERSEGSVSSTIGVVKNDGFDSGLAVGPIFAAVADSENSEDRSSKSSTAASAPRRRSEIPAVGVYMGNGISSKSGDHNSATQRGQQGRSWTETGKKPRGEQVKIEKGNSNCSIESNCKGSNFVFMQGANSVTSKGRQSRSANYDGENSDDEAQGSEQHFAEQLQAGFRKNMAEFEVVSQSNSENNGLSADQDPLLESIGTLQSAQEALAQELQKFCEIGKDSFFFSDLVQDSSPNLSKQQQYESEIVNLKRNVNELESKLDKARSMLEVKEGKVIELETPQNSNASKHDENRKITYLEQRSSRELETELEGLFKQKIEAMVKYLVISRTSEDLSLAAVDKITFLEEQKTVATEHSQLVNFSESVGKKASTLKSRVDKLETERETGEYVKLKKRICKFASLFLIQIVLFVALWFWILQLVPQYTEDVPT